MDKQQKWLTGIFGILCLSLLSYVYINNQVPIDSHEKDTQVLQQDSYPFTKGKYVIHPFEIEKFSPGLSGDGGTVSSIVVEDALVSRSRFSEPVVVSEDGWRKSKYADSSSGASYSYRVLGQLDNGLYAIITSEYGGGSGVFYDLFVFESKKNKDMVYQEVGQKNLLVLRGRQVLGDRYDGKVQIVGNSVHIGKPSAITSRDNSCVFSFDGF